MTTSNSPEATAVTATVDGYLEAYSEPDRARRGVDTHHGHLRFAWELVGPDGQVAVAGVDVGELAEDGRLRRIVGFFGDLPAREPA